MAEPALMNVEALEKRQRKAPNRYQANTRAVSRRGRSRRVVNAANVMNAEMGNLNLRRNRSRNRNRSMNSITGRRLRSMSPAALEEVYRRRHTRRFNRRPGHVNQHIRRTVNNARRGREERQQEEERKRALKRKLKAAMTRAQRKIEEAERRLAEQDAKAKKVAEQKRRRNALAARRGEGPDVRVEAAEEVMEERVLNAEDDVRAARSHLDDLEMMFKGLNVRGRVANMDELEELLGRL